MIKCSVIMYLFLGVWTISVGCIVAYYANKENSMWLRAAKWFLILGGFALTVLSGRMLANDFQLGHYRQPYSSYRTNLKRTWKRGRKIRMEKKKSHRSLDKKTQNRPDFKGDK